MHKVYEIALSYLRAGLGVIPIKADGSKAPALAAGHKFLKEQPSEHHLKQWFSRGELGIGIPGGSVSGNLECIDFETETIYRKWVELVETELPGLLDMVNVCSTPGHHGEQGRHVRYRLDGAVPGSKKLALEYALDKYGERILDARNEPETFASIETRGEGGYALAPGCPPSCHRSGGTYEHLGGLPLTELFELAQETRDIFILAAMSLNRVPDDDGEYPDKLRGGQRGGDLRPGDDFNQRGPSWAEILEPYDWKAVSTVGGVTRWRRPGKSESWSATTGLCKAQDGAELLWVFSSSASPFEPGKGYSKFRALALLKYRGDLKECTRALGKEGYGEQSSSKRASASDSDGKKSTKADKAEKLLRQLMQPSAAKTWSLDGLLDEKFPPQRWIVDGVIPDEGLTFLGGRKKLGKSWLCLQIAQGVASNACVLGKAVQRGSVVYIVLEDGPRRVSDRFRKQHAQRGLPITLYTQFPPLDGLDGVGELIEVLERKPRLVILDTLAACKTGKTDENAAGPMADMANMLRRLAQHFGVGILVTHHHGKVTGGDPGDDMRGSSAIAAAGDVNLGLYADGGARARLKGEGRDIQPFDLALEFDSKTSWCWQFLGDGREVARNEADVELMGALARIGQGDAATLAELTGKDRKTVFDRLSRLSEEGKIVSFDDPNSGRGRPRKLFTLKPGDYSRGDAFEE